jgi:hypothetical protein
MMDYYVQEKPVETKVRPKRKPKNAEVRSYAPVDMAGAEWF